MKSTRDLSTHSMGISLRQIHGSLRVIQGEAADDLRRMGSKESTGITISRMGSLAEDETRCADIASISIDHCHVEDTDISLKDTIPPRLGFTEKGFNSDRSQPQQVRKLEEDKNNYEEKECFKAMSNSNHTLHHQTIERYPLSVFPAIQPNPLKRDNSKPTVVKESYHGISLSGTITDTPSIQNHGINNNRYDLLLRKGSKEGLLRKIHPSSNRSIDSKIEEEDVNDDTKSETGEVVRHHDTQSSKEATDFVHIALPGQGYGRVLIVDDTFMNRKMLRRVLGSRFEYFDEAENGQVAVEMVKERMADNSQSKYDVITMDYQMPVMDGVTATRLIRELSFDGIIIAVTGNGLEDDILTFKSSGANAVLMKPLDVKRFDDILQSCYE